MKKKDDYVIELGIGLIIVSLTAGYILKIVRDHYEEYPNVQRQSMVETDRYEKDG